MDRFRRDAEYAKLGRTLHADADRLAFLDSVDLDTLAQLRWAVSDRLQGADAARFHAVAAASKLVPVPLAASIARRFFGAELCARLVSVIEPSRGAQFAKVLPVDFMADITQLTDPRGVGPLAERLPTPTMQAIAVALLERDDHITLSHFVPHLPASTVSTILDAVDDDAVVVRIAQYVDDTASLSPIVAELTDSRIERIVDAVAAGDLWHQGLALFEVLAPDQVLRVARVIAALDDDRLVALIDAVDRQSIWPDLLAFLDRLDPTVIERVAPVLAGLDDAVVDRAVEAAAVADEYSPLARCAIAVATQSGIPGKLRQRLRTVIGRQSPDRIGSLVDAAAALGAPDVLERLGADQ